MCGLVQAQPSPSESAALRQLPADVAAKYDQSLAVISTQKADIQHLEERIARSEGLMAEVFVVRLDRIWTAIFKNTLSLASDVAAQIADGRDVAEYRSRIVAEFEQLPGEAKEAIRRLRTRVVFPFVELTPEEKVVADRTLVRLQLELDELYRVLFTYTRIGADFGLDADREESFLKREVAESAANRSAFLERAISDIETLQQTVDALPENANLVERLLAAQARVELAAQGMEDAVNLMSDLGLDTTQYREQLLRVTGTVTTDVFDLEVLTGLVAGWAGTVGDVIAEDGPQLVFTLMIALAIMVIAYQFGKVVQNLVGRVMDSSRLQISSLLRQMILSTVRNLVLFLGVMVAISQLGVSIGPLLAGFGIAGFIVGFALQDTLGNFASGMLILLYRPFDVGDVVLAGGVEGTVSHMSLVNTTFLTFDNQRLVVPNNLIWGSVITNLTAQRTRRVDLVFGIAYEDDVEKAESILTEIVQSHAKVLKEPEPLVKVHELADSSVNFAVRPWVATDDYWQTYWDLTKAVKMRFDEVGITIPYPQRDVHVLARAQEETAP
jgi:small conductance mechanosensitive channel